MRKWTIQDKVDLESGEFTMQEFAEVLGVSVYAVRGFVYRNNIKVPRKLNHTKREINIVKGMYRNFTGKEIAEKMGISVNRVNAIAKKVGIVKKTRTNWTYEEDEFIMSNKNITNLEMAKIIGKTRSAVSNRKIVLNRRK